MMTQNDQPNYDKIFYSTAEHGVIVYHLAIYVALRAAAAIHVNDDVLSLDNIELRAPDYFGFLAANPTCPADSPFIYARWLGACSDGAPGFLEEARMDVLRACFLAANAALGEAERKWQASRPPAPAPVPAPVPIAETIFAPVPGINDLTPEAAAAERQRQEAERLEQERPAADQCAEEEAALMKQLQEEEAGKAAEAQREADKAAAAAKPKKAG